ncbi:hypothetical protein [Halarchaeum acidiphilum]|uniref:hypothetical protein n=1 Tax=Halarchaeum acidiphilum TaxID=489138 RepID=UPI000677661F|nr:hypothetical protein [Halarchaeum acidiphilum]
MTRPAAALDDAFVRVAARLPEVPVPVPADLDETLDALDWRAAPADVARVAALFVALAAGSVSLAVVAPLPALVLAAYVLAGACAARHAPSLALALRESRLVGAVPGSSPVSPSASGSNPPRRRGGVRRRDGRDALADALTRAVRATAGTPETPLDAVAPTLPTPGLRRAVALVRAAVETPAADRGRVLDRALSAAHDATERHVRTGTRAVRGPVNAVYAFGVILPLALVGLVPVAPAAGVALPLGLVAVCYDAVLPLALLAVAAWALANRPAVFPAGRADATADRDRRRAVLAGLGAGALAALGCVALGVAWALPVSVPCCAVGVALAVATRASVAVDERADAVADGLPDVTAVVGRRLAAGDPPETAVAAVGDALPGPAGELFAAADRTRRALGRPLDAAFFGRRGVIGPEHGPRVAGTVRLVLDAATGGAAGGRVLTEVADGLDAVHRLETEARADLADLVDTLVRTGGLFAPAIAGATVTLAGHVGTFAGTGAALPVPTLGLIVGAYVAWSAVVLTALAVCLDRGVRPAPLCHRVGSCLASAGACYACAAAATALLL